MRTVLLRTPPLPLLVDAHVFDAFNCHASTVMEWRSPAETIEINALDGDLPLRLAFVMRAPREGLPAEVARLHTGRGYGLADEMALAPYAIDDATDGLHANGWSAHEVFWLAADNLNALFWGLHDWAHFHSHGEFTERAATELQCDTAALVWLWINRVEVPLADDAWDRLRLEVIAAQERLHAREPPTVPADLDLLRDRARLLALAADVARGASLR